MSENDHDFHKIIGNIIDRNLPKGYRLIKSDECGGGQDIPLFCSDDKSRKNEYCKVDLLVLKDCEVRSIIEIEESDNKPQHICGKFLASALTKSYIHENEDCDSVPMSDLVTFIQIIDSAGLDDKGEDTSKFKQWKNLESSIRGILPLSGSNVEEYKLLCGDKEDFSEGGKGGELVAMIKENLE